MYWHRELPVLLLLAAILAVTAGAQHRRSGESSPSLSREMLAAHNAVRAQVNVPPLIWSRQLAARAQDWADFLARSRRFYHRPGSNLGENIFEISGAPASPAEVVADWASEAHDYNYRANTCRAVCGHYTQLVWGTTREVGCAVARADNREVWVCNYAPHGNWVGERPY
ncbi:MAG TPA: CAP domain-containing protein [Bryobacteraceae bacterium]|nr:CAP domain-containing protein [Bryobacteraceae bacterium]